MQQPFSEYIKIIGKGQKGGRSLTRDEAYHAMKMVLANEVTGDQRGAFLMLLRTREETPEEVSEEVEIEVSEEVVEEAEEEVEEEVVELEEVDEEFEALFTEAQHTLTEATLVELDDEEV